MPHCQRPGCSNPVSRNSHKYCSSGCAQLSARKNLTRHAPDTAPDGDRTVVDGHTGEVTKHVSTEVTSLDDLIRVCAIDTKAWTITRWSCERRPLKTKDAYIDGFQIKAQLVARFPQRGLVEAEIADLKALAKRDISIERPALRRPARTRQATGHRLELGLYDAHFGKLAWARETGGVNYDIKIARQDAWEALHRILDRTSQFTFDEIIFCVGNDILNSDNDTGSTYSGTPQDVDSRYHKSFRYVREFVIEATETLRTIAPVYVPLVKGNHDRMSVWHLGDSLECYYHDRQDVTVDNEPRQRKYKAFGKVMLMFTHGDREKGNDLGAIMAAEEPEMWGRTVFREAHVGHLHHAEVKDNIGYTRRQLRALCPVDAYHSERGFIGVPRGAEAFVWHEDEGLIATALYTPKNREVRA